LRLGLLPSFGLNRYISAMKTWRKYPLAKALLFVGICYFAYPLYWLVINSSKGMNSRTDGGVFGGANPFDFISNIIGLFTQPDSLFGRWFLNSVAYTAISAIGATLFAAMAGYALAVYKFKGSGFIQFVLISLVMVPPNTIVLPLFLFFAKIHLVNTPAAVILPGLVSPVGAFFMLYYVRTSVPLELIQAARLDRASEFRIFYRIAMPIAKPMVVIVFLIVLIANWNAYFLPLVMLNDEKLYTLQVGLGTSYGGGGLIIGSIVSTIPVLIAYLYLQKHINTDLWNESSTATRIRKVRKVSLPSTINAETTVTVSEKLKQRINGANGFRAAACLLVLLHHAIQRMIAVYAPWWVKTIFLLGWRGEVGVSIFFVLSGCLLAYPFWDSYVNAHKMPNLLDYFSRRLARIAPGAWLALIVTTFVGVVYLHYPMNWTRFLAGVFFVFSFHYKTFFPSEFDGPLWTVGLEVWCYIIMPAVILISCKYSKKLNQVWIWLLGWLLLLQILQPIIIHNFMTGQDSKGWMFGLTGGAKLWMPYWNFATFFAQYLCGVAAAFLIVMVRKNNWFNAKIWDTIAVAALVAALALVCLREVPGVPDTFTKQPYNAPFYSLLIGLALAATACGNRVWRLFDNRLFNHIAKISFGLYLWHWFLITLMQATIATDFTVNGLPDLYRWLGLVVFTYSIAWVIAVISWKYLESPILNYNQARIARRHQKL
jgi:ABC-type glycerol-3-phosphate transport system permease component/peptidoglycan/LPS O-acetylase OafA/YrhL